MEKAELAILKNEKDTRFRETLRRGFMPSRVAIFRD